MAKNKKVASLLEKKRLISKEIEDLQNMCEHKNKIIKSTKENEVSSGFIIRRVCEHCNNYVPFVRLITENETRVYQCMTCKTKHVQHVNGKVVFNFLEDAYTLKRN